MTNNMTIEQVIDEASTYLHKQENIDLIKKAYEFAAIYHQGQFRKSNEPYITHPLEVAYMLTTLKTGPATIAAGLLHDVVEDTEVTFDEIEKNFGSDIRNIVDGVTKIGKLKYMTKEKILAKTHQKIILAMAKDIRVVLVKLVDRVHNMRTLEFQSSDKQKSISKETLDLYAPLAHRLGMYRIKAELEDLSYKYLNPEKYQNVYDLVINHRKAREDDISKMRKKLESILEDNHFKDFEIKGRIKNIYSICKKMIKKNLEFEEIFDLLALRILVPTIEDCYRALGLVHGEWTPIPMRFKDYIATPKPNLYQSLHTTVVGNGGKIYEIQIRTFEMNKVAELGIAAHWAYKEDTKYSPEKEQNELKERYRWYRELLTYAESATEDDEDPLNIIQEDIFSANVYVFTPNGDVLDFPNGATPLDFAYRIHTEVGNHTVGAIVNGKMTTLNYKLKTGDVVEIKTNKSFNGPTEAWVKIVKTSHAKHKIIAILNKRNRDTLIEKGKLQFEEALKLESKELKLTDKTVSEFFSKFSLNNVDDFYCEIGKGSISPRGAVNKIFGKNVIDSDVLISMYNDNEKRMSSHKHHSQSGIVVEGLERAQIKLSSCCHPVMGDDIIGYVSKSSGIVVHRSNCINAKNIEKERYITVGWDNTDKKSYESLLSILSYNRKNIIADIINILNSYQLSIISISSSVNKSTELLTKIKFNVANTTILEKAMTNIEKIPDVYKVERVIR